MKESLFYTEENLNLAVDFVDGFIEKTESKAVVLCLEGDLGAGKTTLTKELIKRYGYGGIVQSPTFVIAKHYQVDNVFKKIIHIDAYRIEDISELDPIGFDKLLVEENNLIIIEWPSNIKNAIPADSLWFKIKHDKDGRVIEKYEGEK